MSYVFNKDAQFFSALTDKEIVNLSLDALVRRHGPIAREKFDLKNWEANSAIQRWDLDNHYHAAFIEYGVQQRNMYLVDPLKSIRKVI